MKRNILFLLSVAAVSISACSGSAPDGNAEMTERVEGKPDTVVTPITEAASIDAGLAIGEQVPLATSLLTNNGETTLEKILETGPALVVFTRSVEWCPYCQTQLKAINSIVGDLKDRGYKLYGLSYDSPDKQDRFFKNQMLQYDMLSDQPSAVIDAFGLRDPQYTEGRAAGVPYASVFVIAENGEIIARFVSDDYKKRPTNEQILALVDSI